MNKEQQAVMIMDCLRSPHCETRMQELLEQFPLLPNETKNTLRNLMELGKHFLDVSERLYEKVKPVLNTWELPATDKITIEDYAKLRMIAKLADELELMDVTLDKDFLTKMECCRSIVDYAELKIEQKYSFTMYAFTEFHINPNKEFCLKLSKFVALNLPPELVPDLNKNTLG